MAFASITVRDKKTAMPPTHAHKTFAETIRTLSFPVRTLVGVPNLYGRSVIRDVLRTVGINQIQIASDVRDIGVALDNEIYDLIIVTDELNKESTSPIIKLIREGNIGAHPFPLIIMLMFENHGRKIVLDAMTTGLDDICVSPISADKIRHRVNRLLRHRAPFIGAAHYIGPERRRIGRAESWHPYAKSMPAPHPVQMKITGVLPNEFTTVMTKEALRLSQLRIITGLLEMQALLSEAKQLCSKSHPPVEQIQNATRNILETANAITSQRKGVVDSRFFHMASKFQQDMSLLTLGYASVGLGDISLQKVFSDSLGRIDNILAGA